MMMFPANYTKVGALDDFTRCQLIGDTFHVGTVARVLCDLPQALAVWPPPGRGAEPRAPPVPEAVTTAADMVNMLDHRINVQSVEIIKLRALQQKDEDFADQLFAQDQRKLGISGLALEQLLRKRAGAERTKLVMRHFDE